MCLGDTFRVERIGGISAPNLCAENGGIDELSELQCVQTESARHASWIAANSQLSESAVIILKVYNRLPTHRLLRRISIRLPRSWMMGVDMQMAVAREIACALCGM